MCGWSPIRDTLESAASIAGNIFLPGSSLLTSQMVSKGSQAQLHSALGTAVSLGASAYSGSGMGGSDPNDAGGGLGSLSDADSAAGDSALGAGETSANLGTDYANADGSYLGGGDSGASGESGGVSSDGNTFNDFGSSLQGTWKNGMRVYKGYKAVQNAKHGNWLGATQDAWGAYGDGAGLGNSSSDPESLGGDDTGGVSDSGGGSPTGGSNMNDSGFDWDGFLGKGSSGDTGGGWGDSFGGNGDGAPTYSVPSESGGGDAGGMTDNGASPLGSSGQSTPNYLRSLYQQGNQYLKPLGGIKGGLKAAGTLYQMYGQHKQAGLAKNYMDQMSGMYQPGTPEYEQFSKELAAQDAAHGRRSQVGSRSVQLAAAMAQHRAQLLSSPAYQSALGAYGSRNSSTLNGLFSIGNQLASNL